MMVRGLKFKDRADLLSHLHALIESPWISASILDKNARKRRGRHLRTAPITLQGTYVYRSDGAARDQGRDTDIQAAYGAALFDGNSIIAHISHSIPSYTNNIAEYS